MIEQEQIRNTLLPVFLVWLLLAGPATAQPAAFDLESAGGPTELAAFATWTNHAHPRDFLPVRTGGQLQIFCRNNNSWLAMVPRTDGPGFRQTHVAGIQAIDVAGLAVGNVLPGHPGRELVVINSQGGVSYHDLTSKKRVGGFQSGVNPMQRYSVADLDLDGRPELILGDRDRTAVFNGQGELLWQVDDVSSGPGCVVGQMDSDPSLEIAFGSGFIVDVAERAVQWRNATAFGLDIQATDIDGDGLDEIVAVYFPEKVIAWDIDLESVKWEIPIDRATSLAIDDLDDDGELEIIVGTDNESPVSVYSATTRQIEGSIPESGSADKGLITFRPSVPGPPQVLWSGRSLSLADGRTRQLLWREETAFKFTPPVVGDIDGDGLPEVVVATENPSKIQVYRLPDLTLVWQEPDPRSNPLTYQRLRLRDVDGDGDQEIFASVFAGSYFFEIHDFDPNTGTLEKIWEPITDSTHSFSQASEWVDVTGDGQPEVLIGGGGDFQSVFAFDFATRQEYWRTPPTGPGGGMKELVVANVDADPAPEILALLASGGLHIFDVETFLQEWVIPGDFQSFALLDEEGGPYLVLGDEDGFGEVHRHDGVGYRQVGREQLSDELIAGFLLDDSGVWFGADRRFNYRRNIFAPTTWSSDQYSLEQLGTEIRRVDWQGKHLILAGTSKTLHLFEPPAKRR